MSKQASRTKSAQRPQANTDGKKELKPTGTPHVRCNRKGGCEYCEYISDKSSNGSGSKR